MQALSSDDMMIVLAWHMDSWRMPTAASTEPDRVARQLLICRRKPWRYDTDRLQHQQTPEPIVRSQLYQTSTNGAPSTSVSCFSSMNGQAFLLSLRQKQVQGLQMLIETYRLSKGSPTQAGGAWLAACLAPVACARCPAVVVDACKLIAAAHDKLPRLLRIDVNGVEVHPLHLASYFELHSQQDQSLEFPLGQAYISKHGCNAPCPRRPTQNTKQQYF